MSAHELHELLVKAVAFVPEDEGGDAETDVTVSLEDLRDLITVAWKAVDAVEKGERETRKYRELYRECAQRERSKG